jgi:hypothetical protein
MVACYPEGTGYDHAVPPQRIGGFFFESRARYVIVRKATALAISIEDGNVTKSLKSPHSRAVLKDARTTAAKLCGLPGVCS